MTTSQTIAAKAWENPKYKYLIERKDTREWYCTNITGYFGHTYTGEPFGEFPDQKNDWTRDGNQALQFDSKEKAIWFLDSLGSAHGLDVSACEITEHEFIQDDAPPTPSLTQQLSEENECAHRFISTKGLPYRVCKHCKRTEPEIIKTAMEKINPSTGMSPKQMAIEWNNKYWDLYPTQNQLVCAAFISGMEVDRWVPCEKELPKPNQNVLVVREHQSSREPITTTTIVVAWMNNIGKWVWAESGQLSEFSIHDYTITHWQPLPSLPVK